MIVDIHAHMLPEAILQALQRQPDRFPSVELLESAGQFRLAFAGRAPTRPMLPRLRHAAPRAEFMAVHGLDRQLAGGWLDAFGYELPAEEGAEWSRFLNRGMWEAAAEVEGLVPLATVPLQDGRLAAAVLEEAVAAGFPGAMVGTRPMGGRGMLDDPALDPFWERAAALGVPVMVHPEFGSDDERLNDMGMMNTVGRVTDITIALSRLLFAGHPQRFTGLKLIAATGGGALPYVLGRLARNYVVEKGKLHDPVEGITLIWFDSLVFLAEAIRFLTDLVGVERVMLGSDYPFPIGDPTPRRVIEDSGYSADQAALLLGGNARALFGL
jgi:aminocarboxymuconate-semialdehyde decarboxylase